MSISRSYDDTTTTHEEYTILGIYRSPKVPVRQLYKAMTKLLNGISPDNISFMETLVSLGLLKQREDLYII